MADRAAFEAWHGAHACVVKFKDGRYASPIVESQWQAWQEAARQEREAASVDAARYRFLKTMDIDARALKWRNYGTSAEIDAAIDEAIRFRSSATGEKG